MKPVDAYIAKTSLESTSIITASSKATAFPKPLPTENNPERIENRNEAIDIKRKTYYSQDWIVILHVYIGVVTIFI